MNKVLTIDVMKSPKNPIRDPWITIAVHKGHRRHVYGATASGLAESRNTSERQEDEDSDSDDGDVAADNKPFYCVVSLPLEQARAQTMMESGVNAGTTPDYGSNHPAFDTASVIAGGGGSRRGRARMGAKMPGNPSQFLSLKPLSMNCQFDSELSYEYVL